MSNNPIKTAPESPDVPNFNIDSNRNDLRSNFDGFSSSGDSYIGALRDESIPSRSMWDTPILVTETLVITQQEEDHTSSTSNSKVSKLCHYQWDMRWIKNNLIISVSSNIRCFISLKTTIN